MGPWRSVGVRALQQMVEGAAAGRQREEMIFIDGVGNVREMGLPEQERAFSLDGDLIARGAVNDAADDVQGVQGYPAARRCFFCSCWRGASAGRSEGVPSRTSSPRSREVPPRCPAGSGAAQAHSAGPARRRAGDQTQAGRWRRAANGSADPSARGSPSNRAVSEFRKRNSVVPQPEVVKKLKAEYEGRA